MFKKEKIKPENSLLQPHKQTTLEKNQDKREKRKAELMKHFNKFAKDMA
jgi:uncharacterized membrane-anchored protein YhcB (DUF1043 family)